MVVASFHLFRHPAGATLRHLARVPLDRRTLRRHSGARFVRLLGTGRGAQMARSADLSRWAIFATWDDRSTLDRFLARDDLPPRPGVAERYDVVLEPIAAHGSWDGVDPTGSGVGSRAGVATDHARSRVGGPVAVLTRATVRWRRVPAFLRAVPPVDDAVAVADGLWATVGIGELPVGRQATFSLWRDAEAVRRFAYAGDEHADVIRRTRDEGWYGEEWFARFRPIASSGTWDGVDPSGGTLPQL